MLICISVDGARNWELAVSGNQCPADILCIKWTDQTIATPYYVLIALWPTWKKETLAWM